MADLEIEGVDPLTMKEVITPGADQEGRLNFKSQLNFLSLINKLNCLKMGKWEPKLFGLSQSLYFDSFNSSTRLKYPYMRH